MVAGRMSPTGPWAGSNNDMFNKPSAVFVDASDNIYVADEGNSRIQKWVPGSITGTRVAGLADAMNNPNQGNESNQLKNPKDVYVDSNGTIFIADHQNSRIQKWTQGSTTGVTIAGKNKAGNAADFLAGPTNLAFDSSGNMFISDLGNNRIQKWAPNASSGTTVAGGTMAGSSSNLLNGPQGVFIDQAGNIYIADTNNHRIQKWGK
jgi:sugar lactone lactonase YvrE